MKSTKFFFFGLFFCLLGAAVYMCSLSFFPGSSNIFWGKLSISVPFILMAVAWIVFSAPEVCELYAAFWKHFFESFSWAVNAIWLIMLELMSFSRMTTLIKSISYCKIPPQKCFTSLIKLILYLINLRCFIMTVYLSLYYFYFECTPCFSGETCFSLVILELTIQTWPLVHPLMPWRVSVGLLLSIPSALLLSWQMQKHTSSSLVCMHKPCTHFLNLISVPFLTYYLCIRKWAA